jgi:hypothetical protein
MLAQTPSVPSLRKPDVCGSTWMKGEAGTPVTAVSLPGRRAASGRPQGRP